jgi:tetratricopeptide (TPR) repeat protein
MIWRRAASKRSAATLLCAWLLTTAAASISADQPSDEAAAIASFELLIKAERYAQAASELERYTKAHPDSWRALYQLGYVDFRLHRITESVAALSKSLVRNTQFAEAHKILAFDLNILGRKDLAIAELEKSIALAPTLWESRYELGRIYYEQAFYLKAVEQFEQVIAAEPSFVKAYHNLGLAYAGIGDHSKAVANFEQGLRLNANQETPSAWPLIDYATYCNLQSDFERARALLEQAIRINGSWQQEYEELSKAQRGLGQLPEAIQSLKKAVELNPAKAENHYILARLYSQTHQPEQAKMELAAYELGRHNK